MPKTSTPAAAVREEYPTTYLLYGQCLAIGRGAGIGARTIRVWLKDEHVPHRQFRDTTARKHYHRDSLIALLFDE